MLQTGLRVGTVNSVVWYLSTMLLCMSILYPLLRKYLDFTKNLFVPLAALLLLGYLCVVDGAPRNPTKYLSMTYKGNIRGFAELCIGIMAYYMAGWLSHFSFSNIGKMILSAIKWGCYFSFVAYMYYESATETDCFIILVLALAVSLTFAEVGLFCKKFNKPVVYALGKFSVPLYFGHQFYVRNLNNFSRRDGITGPG